jgi:hypothetical protein
MASTIEPQDRTPEQVEDDREWLRRLREQRASDPDNGKFGGIERRWDDYAAVKA